MQLTEAVLLLLRCSTAQKVTLYTLYVRVCLYNWDLISEVKKNNEKNFEKIDRWKTDLTA